MAWWFRGCIAPLTPPTYVDRSGREGALKRPIRTRPVRSPPVSERVDPPTAHKRSDPERTHNLINSGREHSFDSSVSRNNKRSSAETLVRGGRILKRVFSTVSTHGLTPGLARTARIPIRRWYERTSMTFGMPIYGQDWDVLVVLDACRPDTLEEVSEGYDFVPSTVDTVYSLGSSSWPWMSRNFTAEFGSEMAETAYIVGNPFSSEYLSEDEFGLLDEVWRYAWDDEIGTIRARALTDRAIQVARSEAPERLIVHYMQPHFPSVPKYLGYATDLERWGTHWDSPWKDASNGKVERAELVEAYRANLRYVLDDVELLIQNVDAERVVITADHGNAFGEWGVWGHPQEPLPVLRRVPWVVTQAQDTGEYIPDTEYEQGIDIDEGDRDERLRALGYVE